MTLTSPPPRKCCGLLLSTMLGRHGCEGFRRSTLSTTQRPSPVRQCYIQPAYSASAASEHARRDVVDNVPPLSTPAVCRSLGDAERLVARARKRGFAQPITLIFPAVSAPSSFIFKLGPNVTLLE
jgi:hypothetical protein